MMGQSNEMKNKYTIAAYAASRKIVVYLFRDPRFDTETLLSYSITDFCKENDIPGSQLESRLTDLRKRSMRVTLPDGRVTDACWVERYYIHYATNTIQLEIGREIRALYEDLRKQLSDTDAAYMLFFRGKHTPTFYRFLVEQSAGKKVTLTYGVEELKDLLDIHIYPRYETFKTRVLLPAIAEINDFTDKHITFVPGFFKRTVQEISLIVEPKGTVVADK